MATKQSDERPTKRRARQAQPETGTKKPASKPAAKKRAAAAAKKRSDKTPAKRSRPTLPARPRAKRAEAAEPIESAPGESAPGAIPVPVPVPAPTAPRQEDTAAASAGEPPSRPASYLESVPRDHAELLSAFLQVVRGAAKDIKTLITQAIAMSHQDDRIDR